VRRSPETPVCCTFFFSHSCATTRGDRRRPTPSCPRSSSGPCPRRTSTTPATRYPAPSLPFLLCKTNPNSVIYFPICIRIWSSHKCICIHVFYAYIFLSGVYTCVHPCLLLGPPQLIDHRRLLGLGRRTYVASGGGLVGEQRV
jgi:hypothetical protein